MSFYSKKIPVLHFFTGTHEDYHRATDTWEKLNIEGMAKISDLVLVTALEIANRKEPIRFVSLPSRPGGSIGSARGIRVYLGTIPDYGAVATGVFLWSRRNQISDQLENLADQIGEWRGSPASGGDMAIEDSSPSEAFASNPGSRRSQAEISEEALTLKETGQIS